jgi:hypothetical protein
MDTDNRPKNSAPRPTPISAGTARIAAKTRINNRITRQDATSVRDAMNRVQPRHKGYVMKRAEGLSPAEAWEESMPRVNAPSASAKRLEERPVIRTAIAAAEAVVLRGSLMSAAQRRDHVLDRLLVESLESGDSGRVTSLLALGKTCGLFLDKSEHATTAGQGVRQRIDALLKSITERDVVDAGVAALDADSLLDASKRVNDDAVEDAQVVDSNDRSPLR